MRHARRTIRRNRRDRAIYSRNRAPSHARAPVCSPAGPPRRSRRSRQRLMRRCPRKRSVYMRTEHQRRHQHDASVTTRRELMIVNASVPGQHSQCPERDLSASRQQQHDAKQPSRRRDERGPLARIRPWRSTRLRDAQSGWRSLHPTAEHVSEREGVRNRRSRSGVSHRGNQDLIQPRRRCHVRLWSIERPGEPRACPSAGREQRDCVVRQKTICAGWRGQIEIGSQRYRGP
jgi:hypothetical protein